MGKQSVKIFWTLLFSLLSNTLIANTFYPSKSYSLEVNQKYCQHILSMLRDTGYSAEHIHWGSLDDIEKILKRAGYPDTFIKTFAHRLDTILRLPASHSDRVLLTAVRFWQQKKSTEGKLILCHLVDCKKSPGLAAAATIVPFKLVSRDQLNGQNLLKSKVDVANKIFTDFLIKEPTGVFISQKANVDPEFMVTVFFHEATHFANRDLRNHWLYANLRRLQLSQKPDQLFLDNVGWQDGNITMADDFFLAFEETRAYRAQFFAQQRINNMHLTPHAFGAWAQSQIWEILKADYPPQLVGYFQRQGIKPNGLFDWVDRVEETMLKGVQ